MGKMKILIAFMVLAISQSFYPAFAQKADNTDSVSDGSKFQSEAAILYQQQVLDSLIKIRLLSDLEKASGNNRKTRELEKKLKNIETEDSLRKIELIAKLNTLRQNSTGSAVVPFNDTLFLIYSNSAIEIRILKRPKNNT